MSDPADSGQGRECLACDLALIACGLIVGGLVVFMAIDLASDGRMSVALAGALSRGRAGLATVTDLRAGDDAAG
jgi:hypothetical protein